MSVKATKLITEIGDPEFTDDFEILQFCLLNRTNIGENSNKFYVIELHYRSSQSQSKYLFRVFTHYGRVGDKGVKDGRYFNSQHDAEREYGRIKRQKTGASKGRGYKEVDVARMDVGSFKVQEQTKIAKVETKTVSSSKSSIDPAVQWFINRIYDESKSTLKHFVDVDIKDNVMSTPLGVVSQNQIDNARKTLVRLRDNVLIFDATRDDSLYTQLVNNYYSLIPHRLPRNIRVISLLDDKEKVEEELEMLRIMQDIFDIADDNVDDSGYSALNAEISVLPETDPKYCIICDEFEKTKGHNHSHLVRSRIKQIFRLKLNSDYTRFNPSKIERKMLWHGSRNAHILGIVSKGLLINPTGAARTGDLLGHGIYFADCSTKSLQYSSTQFSGYSRSVNDCFMFYVDVAVGHPFTVDNSSNIPSTLPVGYHSIMGVKQKTKMWGYSTLEHNEYVVRNINQSRIGYVLHIIL